MEKYRYYIRRTHNLMLPVYAKVVSTDSRENLFTLVKKAEGDLFQLKKDIDEFLFEKYEKHFHAKISELQQSVEYSGDFEEEIKEFLLARGF